MAGALALAVTPAYAEPTEQIVNYRSQPQSVPEIVADEAAKNGVSPALALCVARKETGFNPGSRGAYTGLFQLGSGELNGFYAKGFTDWADPRQQTAYFAIRIHEGAWTGTWPTIGGCV